MSLPTLHNEYAALVSEFTTKVILAQAELAATPDESTAYDESIDLAHRLYEGLNEVTSNLELIIERIPGGGSEGLIMEDAELARMDATADQVIQWQREIEQVKTKLTCYAEYHTEPKNARDLVEALRNVRQRL